MNKSLGILILLFAIIYGCDNGNAQSKKETQNRIAIESRIDELNRKLIEAAKTKNFEPVEHLYTNDALLLTEFHTIIDGKRDILKFYNTIFERHTLKTYKKTTKEILDLGSQILEIGTFTKTFENLKEQEGKYWNIWTPQKNGDLKLQSESYGYFHKIDDYKSQVVEEFRKLPTTTQSRNGKLIPPELLAYDAYTEKIVRERNVEKAMSLYQKDADYYGIAKQSIHGLDDLTSYYEDYYKNPVTIDSISIWTYDYKKVNDGFIKYVKFHVEWTVPEFSGKTSGTNTVYWRRQADGSLKRKRLIGFHIDQF
ncbi:YybH family protein [Spongiivirga citrea]|uniref:DUF4440 domain-containing protein n=1 Tax=Spongiivirga citrea TaxID=1481457 RepID=A0A6M0CLA5_9FLAO|nr:DUF4440 domain-containing protein [Spongiivirga citrea]NER18442.1 hypothetical protein [Spongiivirga citrea]